MQAVLLLDHLPSADRQHIEDGLELKRSDALFPTAVRWEVEHLTRAALDRLQQGEGTPARTSLAGGQAYQVADLVADQGLGAAKENGEQHFGALGASRDRAVVFIDHLYYREILEQMHPLMHLALRCQSPALGGCICLEEFCLPGLLDAPPHVARHHLSGIEDRAWSDVQAALALLLGQPGSNRGIGKQRIWLVLVEAVD